MADSCAIDGAGADGDPTLAGHALIAALAYSCDHRP